MAEITLEMVKKAYNIAKEFYIDKNKKNRDTRIKELHDNDKMGAAKGYVYHLTYLLSGKKYTLTMKADDTKYYLQQILIDFNEKFENALYSVLQHIKYKNKDKKNANYFIRHRELCEEFIKKINIKDERLKNIWKEIKEYDDKIDQPQRIEQPYEIVHRAMDKITEINQNCKNHKRDPIFKQKVHELSRIIEKSCTSKEQFINFTLNLYLIIYETTRKTIPNANTKGKPFYDYKLPDEFIRNGTPTKHFMDIVGTFRHHYAHLEPEYKVTIKKISYEDALFKLSKNRDEPKSREDFQRLQIGVLKLFEKAMESLLEMLKDD